MDYTRIPAITLGALLLLSAPKALAEQRTGSFAMGVAPSYAFVVLENQVKPDGGGGSLFLQYAITEAVEARLSGLWTGHEIPGTEDTPGGLYQVISLALVFSYAFDLAPVRPALEAGIGVLHQRYSVNEQRATSVSLLFGVSADYQLLHWLEVGAAFHYHAFLQNPSQYPVYFDVGPRVIFRFR